MVAFKVKLVQIESRLQALVEGSVARLFPGSFTPQDLAQRLEEAMHSRTRIDPDGEAVAPNFFILLVHPDQRSALQADQVLLDELKRLLYQVGAEAGLRFDGPLVVQTADAPELALGEIQVLARNSLDDLSQTVTMEVATPENAACAAQNAFLIVNGVHIFPLSQPVINIGRRKDNQLVINDPRVSRQHAQLRLVKGQYVIFDLHSTGGTQVNGEPVQQHTLQPGDVISLSGIPLVFGQDAEERADTEECLIAPGTMVNE